jgi:hypothetical protein
MNTIDIPVLLIQAFLWFAIVTCVYKSIRWISGLSWEDENPLEPLISKMKGDYPILADKPWKMDCRGVYYELGRSDPQTWYSAVTYAVNYPVYPSSGCPGHPEWKAAEGIIHPSNPPANPPAKYQEQKSTCPYCGTRNKASRDTCKQCGGPLS